MLPFGHSSAGYLISQIPWKDKRPFGGWEIGLVIMAANFLDIDYLFPLLVGMPMGTHHYLPTHTPFGVAIYWLILWTLLRRRIRFEVLLAMGMALFSHLMLDDMSYWLGLIGLSSQIRPQIFWLYPFDWRMAVEADLAVKYFTTRPWTQNNIFISYLTLRPMLFYCELTLVAEAVWVWIKRHLSNILFLGPVLKR